MAFTIYEVRWIEAGETMTLGFMASQELAQEAVRRLQDSGRYEWGTLVACEVEVEVSMQDGRVGAEVARAEAYPNHARWGDAVYAPELPRPADGSDVAGLGNCLLCGERVRRGEVFVHDECEHVIEVRMAA